MKKLLDFTVAIGLWLLIVSALVKNKPIQYIAFVMSLYDILSSATLIQISISIPTIVVDALIQAG